MSNFPADIIAKTSTEWSAVDPFLAKNDIGVESDTGRQKVGVGLKWSATPYQSLVASPNITRIVQITTAAYAALDNPDPNTLYVIT